MLENALKNTVTALPAVSTRWLTLAASVLCLALAAGPADAKSRSGKRAQPKEPKVTYVDGQTPAQRQRSEEARLRRECQGRPNAGACLGYTQPRTGRR